MRESLLDVLLFSYPINLCNNIKFVQSIITFVVIVHCGYLCYNHHMLDSCMFMFRIHGELCNCIVSKLICCHTLTDDDGASG